MPTSGSVEEVSALAWAVGLWGLATAARCVFIGYSLSAHTVYSKSLAAEVPRVAVDRERARPYLFTKVLVLTGPAAAAAAELVYAHTGAGARASASVGLSVMAFMFAAAVVTAAYQLRRDGGYAQVWRQHVTRLGFRNVVEKTGAPQGRPYPVSAPFAAEFVAALPGFLLLTYFAYTLAAELAGDMDEEDLAYLLPALLVLGLVASVAWVAGNARAWFLSEMALSSVHVVSGMRAATDDAHDGATLEELFVPRGLVPWLLVGGVFAAQVSVGFGLVRCFFARRRRRGHGRELRGLHDL